MLRLLFIFLLSLDWTSVGIGGGIIAGFFTILAFLLKWWRFAPKDRAEVKREDALIQKTQAEAQEIFIRGDATVAELAMNIAKDLRTENEVTKQKLEKTEAELDKSVELCRLLTIQLDDLKREHEKERARNEEMTKKISELMDQISKLQKKTP